MNRGSTNNTNSRSIELKRKWRPVTNVPSSQAIPRSLLHRLLLHLLVTSLRRVATNQISELATEIIRSSWKQANRPWQMSAYSWLTIPGPTLVSPRGAWRQPPGPNPLFRIRRYLIWKRLSAQAKVSFWPIVLAFSVRISNGKFRQWGWSVVHEMVVRIVKSAA